MVAVPVCCISCRVARRVAGLLAIEKHDTTIFLVRLEFHGMDGRASHLTLYSTVLYMARVGQECGSPFAPIPLHLLNLFCMQLSCFLSFIRYCHAVSVCNLLGALLN